MDAIQFTHDLIRQLSAGAIDMDDIQKQVHDSIPEPTMIQQIILFACSFLFWSYCFVVLHFLLVKPLM